MKIVKLILATMLTGTFILASGCTNHKEQAEKEILTVSAAASLTDCMEEMKDAFNEENPNINLQFNFGASGTLQKQIEQGAPVDLFFSAGKKQMKALEEKGLMLDGSVEELVSNRLVLIAPVDGKISLTFKTLGSSGLDKMAIGEVESVPVGQYSMEVLDTLGLTDTLEPNLVYAKDVREVLTWVETGNVEAGIVYETDATTTNGVVICDIADESWHTPVTYPVGIVKSTTKEEAAKSFIDFMKSEQGKTILQKYGFTPRF